MLSLIGAIAHSEIFDLGFKSFKRWLFYDRLDLSIRECFALFEQFCDLRDDGLKSVSLACVLYR
jgi:hypothetical protein